MPQSEPHTTPEAALKAVHAAAVAGDEEATDRHWREFVRLLWATMPGVPWRKAEEVPLP